MTSNNDYNSTPPKMKRCLFCAEEILIDAIKCKHCGEWLAKGKGDAHAPQSIYRVPQFSYAQKPFRLIFISIISCGLYEIYWHFRTWKQLKLTQKLSISPFWRTVGGVFVPFVNYFIVYNLFHLIKNFGEKNETKTFASPFLLSFPYATLGTLSLLFAISNELSEEIPSTFGEAIVILFVDVLWLLISNSILAVVQKSLNRTWQKVSPELKIRERFSDGEIAVMFFGIILWIFLFIDCHVSF